MSTAGRVAESAVAGVICSLGYELALLPSEMRYVSVVSTALWLAHKQQRHKREIQRPAADGAVFDLHLFSSVSLKHHSCRRILSLFFCTVWQFLADGLGMDEVSTRVDTCQVT